MPSPFPGVDPFIEGQTWQDFHGAFLEMVREVMVPQVRPRYVVKVEEYVFVAAGDDGEREEPRGPDVTVALARGKANGKRHGGAAAVALRPVVRTIPLPARRRRQRFLTVRTRTALDVVTVVELLSPWNKDAGQGHGQYLRKREHMFGTRVNLVELDLLRDGVRLPTRERLPRGDYFAFVCRRHRLPKVDVFAWSLRDRLPRIPIPLADGDPDTTLDLQAVFTATYDRTGYDYVLDYSQEVSPALNESDAKWVRQVLNDHAKRRRQK